MRFRIIATAIREYEVDPANYPWKNVKAMLELDREVITDDPHIMLDHPDTRWEICVEDVLEET